MTAPRPARLVLAASALLTTIPPAAAESACPPAAATLEAMATARLVLDREPGWPSLAVDGERRRLAAAEPGRPVTAREGLAATGLVVVPLPVERLWRALNDSEHHPRVMPIEASVLLDGSARGPERRLFQYFKRWGVGRWWINRITVDRALYERTDGALWALRWRDEMRPEDERLSAVREVAADVRPVVSSRGAWLLQPVGTHCTIVEFATDSDPGGLLGTVQRPLIRRAVRDTLEALVELARDHIDLPHPGPKFQRPDGTELG